MPIAIAIVQWNELFLIGRRPETVALSGFWEFPGGKVAEGESVEQAVRRECWEETGLTVSPKKQLGVEQYAYQHATVRLYFFLCHPTSADVPLPPDGPPPTVRAPFVWVPRHALVHYSFPPANASIVARIASLAEPVGRLRSCRRVGHGNRDADEI